MNNPFDYIPTQECEAAFRNLINRLEEMKRRGKESDLKLLHELESGKMLGVLIASDDEGERHTLHAFSGQLGELGFSHPEFVGPVFDYLSPDGYFRKKDRDISRQNREIEDYEKKVLATVIKEFKDKKSRLDRELEEFRDRCKESKIRRDALRKEGGLDQGECERLIRESQFEKAEIRRMKKRMEKELSPYAEVLREAEEHIAELKEKRSRDSESLQQWLFSNFMLLNARGESRSLSEIFAGTSVKIPPSGAGECCAPKLLQEVYRRGWKPLAIAEYWYGEPKGGELRVQGEAYPACRGKCLPVLGWMLQGLTLDKPLDSAERSEVREEPEVIFENEWFCVVNKPAGMLSVPGKVKAESVQEWLAERFWSEREIKMAHRLDRDTSGIIVATFGNIAYKTMQSLFATRKVRKTYIADLEGDYRNFGHAPKGRIKAPLSPDWVDRPRQRVDFEGGKEAVTEYEFIEVKGDFSRVKFHPHTGRTHQLRIHAASKHGLGMPIVGDPLYGVKKGSGNQRLHLHAHEIEFTFPLNGKHYRFESPVQF